MNKKIFNKLVRDKIPQIIESKGEKAVYKILDDKDNLLKLNQKLLEEVNEYFQDGEIEELADVVEVIYGILKAKNTTLEEFNKIREAKKQARGGFDNKIFLQYTISD